MNGILWHQVVIMNIASVVIDELWSLDCSNTMLLGEWEIDTMWSMFEAQHI